MHIFDLVSNPPGPLRTRYCSDFVFVASAIMIAVAAMVTFLRADNTSV